MNLLEQQSAAFARRHIGIDEADKKAMLKTIGVKNLDELINQTVPASIRMQKPLNLPQALSENEYLRTRAGLMVFVS